MFWYEEEVSGLEQKIRNNPDTTRSTVFYGSSSIRLWDTLSQDFTGLKTLNLGFGGSTLAACSWFFERLVLPVQPQSIVFYAGDNDLGDNRHPEEVYQFFCVLSQKMQQYLPNVPLTYLSIKPSPIRWELKDKIAYTNRIIARKIEQLPQFHYVDINSPMLNAAGQPRKELFDADGLHMNKAGYALWKETLLKNQEFFAEKS